MIDTDEIQYALGAVLLQLQPTKKADSSELVEYWVTTGYWSRTLLAAGQNYSTTKRECLSVVWDVNTLIPYIEGTQLVV